MATPRSGAGGKIVTNRRKQRLSATPFDRPPPRLYPPQPPKGPNWFTGVIIPSARALASGAGKIMSSIFSESESFSSEDEDSDLEGDADDTNDSEIPYDGVNTLHQKNITLSEMMQYGQDSQLIMQRTETKRLIEQLIKQETYSRQECDRLIRVLNSRVMDRSMEAGEKSLHAGSSGNTVDHEDVDIYSEAILAAKSWFQKKKVESSSVIGLAHVTCNLNSADPKHLESKGGSPVDVARSYMKDRPVWASPTKNVELRTPLATTMKLFKEGTSYSVGHNSLSSSKKRNSFTSGSWNIQEELRRVRSKATEDMLRSPPTKIDPSLFAVAPIEKSAESDKLVSAMGERLTKPESLRKNKPIDALVYAGMSSDPALAALKPRQDGKGNEALSSKLATSVAGNKEDSEAVQADGECAAFKFIHPSGPNNAGEHRNDPDLSKINGHPATEMTAFSARQSVNGLSSSQTSLSAGLSTGQNNEENHNADTVCEKKSVNSISVEGNCELWSEAYMEVTVVTESDTIPSCSQNSVGTQCEELSLDMAEPSTKAKGDTMAGKQGRKTGKYNRRGRGKR
ncbi:hypothetical protein BUALT_Bualt10G0089400 [Buddleja alternifolia]|uniref:Protein KAKU4 n=1 Tax=Buddleja alternifolia TaxID=168488 RepID=A0AAV6X5F1_9LAMI|nr:hypothetical protein BUALT_Bualt10G0089400 [Buddleja alternifolia]